MSEFVRKFEDSRVVQTKRIIKDIILHDKDILQLLEIKEGDKVISKPIDNVSSYVRMPRTVNEDQCYICISVSEHLTHPTKPHYINQQVTFVIFCQDNYVDSGMNATRPDLIGHCIKDLFQRTNVCGLSWWCQQDEETIVTSGFTARTITFVSRQFNGRTTLFNAAANSAMTKGSDGLMRYTDPEIDLSEDVLSESELADFNEPAEESDDIYDVDLSEYGL